MKVNKYILCCLIVLMALASRNLFSKDLPNKCYRNNPSHNFVITSLFLKNTPLNNTFYTPYLNLTKPVFYFTAPLNYSGNSFFQMSSWNNMLQVNTVITYQKKNTIFLLPYSVNVPLRPFPLSLENNNAVIN